MSQQRQRLRFAVAGMFALLSMLFLYVLLVGLSPPSTEIAESYTDIASGHTELRRHAGERVWVSRISKRQRQRLGERKLETALGCSLDAELCLVFVETQRFGVELRHLAAQPIELKGTREAIWVGGFINPVDGNYYDLLGRAYSKGGWPNGSPQPLRTETR